MIFVLERLEPEPGAYIDGGVFRAASETDARLMAYQIEAGRRPTLKSRARAAAWMDENKTTCWPAPEAGDAETLMLAFPSE